MTQADQIFTATLSTSNVPLVGALNTFTIRKEQGFRGMSIKWVSGTVRFKGSLAVNDIDSSYVELIEGYPFSFSAQLSMNDFTIDVTSGVCEIALIK